MNFNKELKKYQNDCYNRLHSIFLSVVVFHFHSQDADNGDSDAAFVESVADAYKQYPIVGASFLSPSNPYLNPLEPISDAEYGTSTQIW